MAAKSLDYARPAQRAFPKVSLRVAATILVGLAMLTMPFVSVRVTRSRMDAISGSMEWQTTWPLGITSGPRVTPSPLELRLRQRGIRWTPRWQLLHNTHRTLLSTAASYGCGVAPAIYALTRVLPQYVDSATDAELRQFVAVMQNGTDDQQKAAVQAVTDKVMPP